MNKKLLIGLGAGALAVAVFLGFGGSSGDKTAKVAARDGEGAKPNRTTRIAEARPATDGGERVAGERKRGDSLQDALDGERFDEVKRLAEKLVDNPSAEERLRAVEALQWFGEKSLASLTPFLADPDEEVREAAMRAVDQALSEMEDERTKIAYIESLFQIRGACDENGLAMLAGQLNGLSDSVAVLGAAIRVISANRNPAAVKEMKEVYEFITGKPYSLLDR